MRPEVLVIGQPYPLSGTRAVLIKEVSMAQMRLLLVGIGGNFIPAIREHPLYQRFQANKILIFFCEYFGLNMLQNCLSSTEAFEVSLNPIGQDAFGLGDSCLCRQMISEDGAMTTFPERCHRLAWKCLISSLFTHYCPLYNTAFYRTLDQAISTSNKPHNLLSEHNLDCFQNYCAFTGMWEYRKFITFIDLN